MLPLEHLKRLRRSEDITQQQLGDVLGCTKNYISQLENNKLPLSENFYERWIKAIHLLSSMSFEKRAEYIKKLKDELNEEVEKIDKTKTKKTNAKKTK